MNHKNFRPPQYYEGFRTAFNIPKYYEYIKYWIEYQGKEPHNNLRKYRNTSWRKENDVLVFSLYETDIVYLSKNSIRVTLNGYHSTNTTINCINNNTPMKSCFCTIDGVFGCRIHSDKGVNFYPISSKGEFTLYSDGTFTPDPEGKITKTYINVKYVNKWIKANLQDLVNVKRNAKVLGAITKIHNSHYYNQVITRHLVDYLSNPNKALNSAYSYDYLVNTNLPTLVAHYLFEKGDKEAMETVVFRSSKEYKTYLESKKKS